MVLLLCKLALAPAFVVAVTLAVRGFGPRIGGVLGGLPVVAGPILFVITLEHGVAFGADAAVHSLVALVALSAFVLSVAFASPRLGALGSVVVGWAAFCLVAALLAVVDVPPMLGVALSCAAFAGALAALPHPDPSAPAQAPGRPRHDLLLRAGAAAVLVLALTSVAGSLGPAVSGVLAPFPIITSVLLGFAVQHESRATVLRLMRGMVRGFFSFAAFLFVLAVALEGLGTAGAFALAIATTAAIQAGLLTWTQHSAPARAVPAPARS